MSANYDTLHYTGNFIRGSFDKCPDVFRMGTFIDSTHIKL